MGKIVEITNGEDSKDEKLGDLLAEMASSDGGSIDSVKAVRKIRERG